MRILFLFILLINPICAKANIDQKKLKIIEDFLSDMTSLEADMTMDIISENENTNPEHYLGKIWLDRKLGLLRINYGKNFMVAKKGTLKVVQENEKEQEYSTEDTPAGILLQPKIDFEKEGIIVKSLTEVDDLIQLFLVYDSPAGSIPITMYFRPKPVMVLMGWAIQNPNQSITNVYLNPEKTHMSIKIDSSIFKIK